MTERNGRPPEIWIGKLAIFTFNEKLKIKQVVIRKTKWLEQTKETEFITWEINVSHGVKKGILPKGKRNLL